MPLHGLDNLRQALSDIDEPINNSLKAIYLQGLRQIVAGAVVAVDDGGRSASNWFLKVGSPSNQTTEQKNGDPHLGPMPHNVLGKKLYYTNNMPYINKLEYGGYPGNGPKTINGYSDQAPNGWVRKELLVMRAAIRAL